MKQYEVVIIGGGVTGGMLDLIDEAFDLEVAG